MNDNNYVECLVKGKASVLMKFLKILAIMLAAACFLLSMISANLLFIILFVVLAVAAYFANMNADIEYEYLYCDHEISVDKILNKSRRKNVGKFETERMDILAPIKSYHLDEYKNKTLKNLDFSTGEEKQPDTRFVMIYDGREKIVFEPNEEMVEAIKNVAPRKVFKD
ncbi:MAG: DUF6106 family protein [Butyrivibrio sp.]|nr:DUF6106 family protein [Butyrivibrio sp.]